MTHLVAAEHARQAADWAGAAAGGTDTNEKINKLAWGLRELALAVKEEAEQNHRDNA